MKRKVGLISNEDTQEPEEINLKKRKLDEIISTPSVNIAVVGCCHGELDMIYNQIRNEEKNRNLKVDLLIICGDFQACRNMNDLETMNCPVKYRHMRDFHKYYNGIKEAPVLTIFIGGNHEAVAYNLENYYGGWACKNIYFLGYSGCVKFRGLKIAGVSGIFKGYDYNKGYFERLPFSYSNKKTIYHVREYEIKKLSMLSEKIDLFMSHDWPRGVWKVDKDNLQGLFRKHLAVDMINGTLGSSPSEYLLKFLRPKFWFSGHLHSNYHTKYVHDNGEITNFYGASKPKVGENTKFMEIVNVNLPQNASNFEENCLYFDREWLKILKASGEDFPLDYERKKVTRGELKDKIDASNSFINGRIENFLKGSLKIPFNWFRRITNVYDSSKDGKYVLGSRQPRSLENPQRTTMLEFLELTDSIKTMSMRLNYKEHMKLKQEKKKKQEDELRKLYESKNVKTEGKKEKQNPKEDPDNELKKLYESKNINTKEEKLKNDTEELMNFFSRKTPISGKNMFGFNKNVPTDTTTAKAQKKTPIFGKNMFGFNKKVPKEEQKKNENEIVQLLNFSKKKKEDPFPSVNIQKKDIKDNKKPENSQKEKEKGEGEQKSILNNPGFMEMMMDNDQFDF